MTPPHKIDRWLVLLPNQRRCNSCVKLRWLVLFVYKQDDCSSLAHFDMFKWSVREEFYSDKSRIIWLTTGKNGKPDVPVKSGNWSEYNLVRNGFKNNLGRLDFLSDRFGWKLENFRKNRNFRLKPEPEPELSGSKMSGILAGMLIPNFIGMVPTVTKILTVMWDGRRRRRRRRRRRKKVIPKAHSPYKGEWANKITRKIERTENYNGIWWEISFITNYLPKLYNIFQSNGAK